MLKNKSLILSHFKTICHTALCLTVLCFIVALPLYADASTLEKLIPEEMENKGWVLEDDPFIAVDEASLSFMINGAAPGYMKRGVEKAAFVNFEKDQMYLMIEIYQADSQASAEKIYDEFAPVKFQAFDGPGVKSRSVSEIGGGYMLEYLEDNLYIKISITKKTEEAKKSVLECARLISSKIKR